MRDWIEISVACSSQGDDDEPQLVPEIDMLRVHGCLRKPADLGLVLQGELAGASLRAKPQDFSECITAPTKHGGNVMSSSAKATF